MQVTFDHVAVEPALVDPARNFTNGPLIIAALGSSIGGHHLGGVRFSQCTVHDNQARPVLVVDGSGTSAGVGVINGDITVTNPTTLTSKAGCSVVGGGWGKEVSVASLEHNVTLRCRQR
jgi:hypothetical protein